MRPTFDVSNLPSMSSKELDDSLLAMLDEIEEPINPFAILEYWRPDLVGTDEDWYRTSRPEGSDKKRMRLKIRRSLSRLVRRGLIKKDPSSVLPGFNIYQSTEGKYRSVVGRLNRGPSA